MGLPVTAAYIMIAILTVPALTTMGYRFWRLT